MKKILAIAFYHLQSIEDPKSLVLAHKKFLKGKECTCRIYISHEGINAQMSSTKEVFEEYKQFLSALGYKDIFFKKDLVNEQIFPRQTIKLKKQLVAFDEEIDFSKKAIPLSPKEWKEKLDKGDAFVIDVRNHFESEIGHFEGADRPDCETFREFKEYTDKIKKKISKDKEVLMYCTGGIRCEYYSAYMKKKGFDRLYQLDGGVINYGHQEGSKHWKGKLFVFDDRLAVPIDGQPNSPISHCRFCNEPSDTFYNCANMDCNELFLACSKCVEEQKGLCQSSCINGRVRPFNKSRGNKPFCRKHLIDQESSQDR